MNVLHSQACGSHQPPKLMHLWWCVVFSVVALITIAAITIRLDYGRYSEEFRYRGLLGFLGLPSLLALQFGFLLSALIFFRLALRQSSRRGLRVMVWLLGAAAGVYCLSIWLIHNASRHGEFGIGAVATVVLLVYFPGAAFNLVGVPATILYVFRKPRA